MCYISGCEEVVVLIKSVLNISVSYLFSFSFSSINVFYITFFSLASKEKFTL